MGVSTRSEESSAYDNPAPWDPIWEYVFGDDRLEDEVEEKSRRSVSVRGGNSNNRRETGRRAEDRSETTESFLDYILPNEDDLKRTKSAKYSSNKSGSARGESSPFWGSSRSNNNESKSNSALAPITSFEMFNGDDRNEASTARSGNGNGSSSNGNGNGTRMGFWRRNNSNRSLKSNSSLKSSKGNDDESILSFLDQPYEIDEREHKEQQKKTTRRQRKKQRGRNIMSAKKKTNKQKPDEQSWVSALSASFDDDYTRSEWQPAQQRQKQQQKKNKRRLFPWQKQQQQQKKKEDGSLYGSAAGDSWPQLKQRAELEAARSPADTEQKQVFSFDQITGALDSYIEDSASSADGEEDSSSAGDDDYTDIDESSSYETESYRSEGTGSIITNVTDDDGSTIASHSLGSASYQSSHRGGGRASRVIPTAAAAGAAATAAAATAGRRRGAPQQQQQQPNNEVRLRYNPNGSQMSTIHESGSHDAELSANGSASGTRGGSFQGGSFDESFDESSRMTPKSAALPPNSPESITSGDDEGSLRSYFLPPNSLGKVACCRLKDLGPEEEAWAKETGIPIHELTKDELETLFPKLRSIAEDASLARSRSIVIGNSQSFEKDFPAHLQAIVAENGPQSLYEYEYERGTHRVLVYERFDTDPRTMLKIISSNEPPQLLEEDGSVDNTKVIVQVEASTVSRTDCCVREGRWKGNSYIPLPNSPGADVVGKIYRINKQAGQKLGLNVGDRVMALTKYGGNARYLGLDADQLVKVPERIDPAEAACLAETYLTAFQCLHYGQSSGQRYRKGSLKGKSVLILGSMTTTMGKAISQLTTLAAVDNVYATSKPKHYQRLTSIGILPLSHDPLQWFERLQGRIDLVISFDEEVTPLLQKILSNTGEILIVTQTGFDPDKEDDQFSKKSARQLVCQKQDGLSTAQRIHAYNVHNEWDGHLPKSKKDLEHLIELLEATWIVPHILDRIPLSKVARAHEIIEVKNVPGFIVCEPWLVSKSRAVLL